MAKTDQRPEVIRRGARILRTAHGPAIAGFLDDPMTVEVMLNPDGPLWVDRLSEGLADSGKMLSAADGERIVRRVAHHVGVEVHGLAAILKGVMTNAQSALVDTDAVNKAADADVALQELGADLAGMAYVMATITLWDEDMRIRGRPHRSSACSIMGILSSPCSGAT
ncbi:Type II/IV secretion system protein [Pseudooceanicola marinus]|uniref:Type II/IV secretion system protein n=1 Tax=Pseudooceanicola marinus TaxID=396013 RepID=A0A1X6YUJ8_9RHOB|nr:Type II/IV secretion system protein [Pseudooceanicola marinus]